MDDVREVLRQRWWAAVSAACVLVGAAVLPGCGSSDSGSTDAVQIRASVGEWFVDVDEPSANSGKLEFKILNSGSVEHEFLVVKTDVAPGELPVGKEMTFSETGDAVEVVGEVPEWGPVR